MTVKKRKIQKIILFQHRNYFLSILDSKHTIHPLARSSVFISSQDHKSECIFFGHFTTVAMILAFPSLFRKATRDLLSEIAPASNSSSKA